MKIIGVIAEYNPFHNGHAYQIEKIKKELHADFVIAAMSGDFVQRGAPAIIDKYARAKMALLGGADLVLELPVLFATSSAENFAMAGVTLFDRLGCVDGICFGAETDDLSALSSVAAVLTEEPKAYQEKLFSALKDGLSYPAARARALSEFVPDAPNLLASPNNILAVEYLKAIARRRASLHAYPILREGASYHEEKVLAPSNHIRASATGIRNLLADHSCYDALADTMPQDVLAVLKEYLAHAPALDADCFSAQLGYQILLHRTDGFSDILDCNPEISNRICKNHSKFSTFSEFCENNKSRDITYTRMSRILLHILLQLTKESEALGKELDFVPYARILGFRKSGQLLSYIKESSSIPLISKLANAKKMLSPQAYALLEKDIFAADFYEQVKCSRSAAGLPFLTEYERQIVILTHF